MTNDNELKGLLKELLSVKSSVSYDDWHVDFVFIGVGAEGCAIINADPTKTLLIDRKHHIIHYIAIATDTEILDNCTASQKILLPEAAISSAEQLQSYLSDIPTPHMLFIIADQAEISSSMLSSLIAQHLRSKTHTTLGLAIMPSMIDATMQHNVNNFIKSTNTTILIPQKNAYIHISKVLECIIDLFCKTGIIGVDFADVRTILSSNNPYSMQNSIGSVAYIGYGIANGDENSDRAKLAVEKALQNIDISTNKILNHGKNVVYSIRCGNDYRIDEITTIGDIINDACHPDANIIFGVPITEVNNILEVQIIVIWGGEDE